MRTGTTLFLALILAGCGSSAPLSRTEGGQAAAPPSFENLHATLWTATAVEYRASAVQAYRQAALMLERALADTTWTASTAQAAEGAYGTLPPAVVLDVDETVLDNMTYQARLIRDGEYFSGETWTSWVEEAAAVPVPGALEFTRAAAARGVSVIYLTNRDAEGEAATRRNLAAFGFPVEDDPDAVLTQGERSEWRPSDKEPRRRYVASGHRVLLLVGDNLGDFITTGRAGLEERTALYEEHAGWWGTRWIMLPNPQYGSWEAATFGNEYSLGPAERTLRKLGLVRIRAGS